jgi:predicted Rossmann fold flavoprotein
MTVFSPHSPGPHGLSNQEREPERETDLLVVGGGAAGLMCAREAAGRGLRVTLLERNAAPGRKLAVCGGGKANFGNRRVSPADYRCGNGAEEGAFCVPALRAFTPERLLRLVRGWGLPFEERHHGRLFLKVPAQRLVAALAEDCRARGCRLLCRTPVSDIAAGPGGFFATTPGGVWRARALALTAGSPAAPKVGGCGRGYGLAAALGHRVVPPRPALTPLLLGPDSPLPALAGLSLPVRLRLPGSPGQQARSFEDDLLCTHTGLSGPAALKASLFWEAGQEILLDFLPQARLADLFDQPGVGGQTPRGLLRRCLPQRLADALLPPDAARRKIAELSRAARQALVVAVHAHTVRPTGLAGLKQAEVCIGGVALEGLAPQTLQSRHLPGLFMAGEVLDVTGLLGGYNLHWAWASGALAANAAARLLRP